MPWTTSVDAKILLNNKLKNVLFITQTYGMAAEDLEHGCMNHF